MSDTVELESVCDFDEAIEGRLALEKSLSEREISLDKIAYSGEGKWGRLLAGKESYDLTDLSMRQLAKELPSFSLGMFNKASIDLRKRMIEEFVGYAEEETVKFLVGTEGDRLKLRGVVPTSRVTISDSSIFLAIQEMAPDFAVPVLFNARGLEDPSVTRLRLVIPEPMDVDGDRLYIAFDLTSSPLGWSDIEVSLCLYRLICDNGLMVPYKETDGPYFKHNYSGLSSTDFKPVFENAAKSFLSSREDLIKAVVSLTEVRMTKPQVKDAYKKLMGSEQFGKGVVQKAFAIADSQGVANKWEFVNTVTRAAQNYRDELRLRYEWACSPYLNLMLGQEIDLDDAVSRSI